MSGAPPDDAKSPSDGKPPSDGMPPWAASFGQCVQVAARVHAAKRLFAHRAAESHGPPRRFTSKDIENLTAQLKEAHPGPFWHVA